MEQDLTATLALLAATPATLDALLRHLPEALTHNNEGPGTWTVTEVLAHLIHGERTDWLPRVQILLQAGESETFPTFQREAHLGDSRSLPELLNEFAERRAASIASLQALSLKPQDLERRGRHPAFGLVTLSQLLATWPAHDLSHLHQISRILASQYREAVGPWSRYLGVLHCDGHSGKA
jgi:DinB superfamily